jgi:CBS domain-containing protein
MQGRDITIFSDLVFQDEFASLPVNSKLTEVAEILADNQVRVVLATESRGKEETLGIISEQQFLRVCASGVNPKKEKIQDHMETNLLRILDSTPIDAVIRLINEREPDAVIMMDSDRKIKAYISPSDYSKIKQRYFANISSMNRISENADHYSSSRELKSPKSLSNVKTNAKESNNVKGGYISDSDINQMVQLTQHHCSDEGRTNQPASRTGLAHKHILCVRQCGPADISGIWAIPDSQIEEIITNGKKNDLFYVTMVDGEAIVPPSWLAGIDFISSNYSLSMNINCLSMNKRNLLSQPKVSETRSKTKKSNKKITPIVQELISSMRSKSSSGSDKFLLFATFQTA